MSKNFHITQLNLQHNKLANASLDKLQNSPLELLQEPHLDRQGNPCGFSMQKNCFFQQDSRCRAMVRVSQDVTAWKIEEFTGRDMATIGTRINQNTVLFSSVYLDITLEVENNLLEMLIQHGNSKQIPLILGIDSNAHSALWGNETNERGLAMEDLIFANNLTVINSGTKPTFVTGRAETHIDITLANEKAQEILNISSWKVRDDLPMISDHRAITFQVGQYEPLKFTYRNLKKVDWELFKCSLSRKLTDLTVCSNDITTAENLDTLCETFEKCIHETMNEFNTLKTRTTHQWKTWWNESLETQKEDLKKFYKLFKRNKMTRSCYFEYLKSFRKNIEKAKANSWKSFCTENTDAKDISKLCRIIQGTKSVPITLIKDSNGNPPINESASLTNLIKAHFPDCSFIPTRNIKEDAEPNTVSDFLDFVTKSNIRESLDSFGKFKAAGPDEIQPVVLQNLPENGYDLVLSMYKASMKLSYIPVKWRKMNVIFIPKPQKDSYDKPKSFRPITLSNFILKGLERLIQWYLTNEIIDLPLPNQHAYTEGRSCETALCEAVHYMEENINRGEYTLCVSLDCSGAFDNILFDKAEQALQEHGIEGNFRRWILHLLRGREVTFTDKNLNMSRTFFPTKGTPQGGVISPLLWNLIINELIREITTRTDLKVVCYADDILLMSRNKFPDIAAMDIQSGLKIVENWAKGSGLMFNPAKTQVCFVTNKHVKYTYLLKLNGEQLKFAKSFKYLGITIDKTLTWNEHVKNKANKVRRLSHLVKGVVGNKWGLTPDKCIWILTSLIRPVLSYGSLVWAHRLTPTKEKLLTGIQRPLMLACTGAMRSTPQATLEVMLGINPMLIHIQEAGLQAKARYFAIHGIAWDGETHLSRGNSIVKSLKQLKEVSTWGQEYDFISKTRIFTQTITENTGDVSYHIYCDGSKMDNHTGMSSCITQEDYNLHQIGYKLPDYATVFQSEVFAITQALKWMKTNNVVNSNVTIWSDSQAAIAAISNTVVKSRTVKEAKLLLIEAQKENNVKIHWIRGHNDSTGNELADAMAKMSAICGEYHHIPPPLIVLKSSIKDIFKQKWEQYWAALDGLEHSKRMIPKVIHTNLLQDKWSRGNLAILAEIVSGHSLLNKHMCIWREEIISPLCRLCNEGLETPAHLFFDCWAQTLFRTQFWLQQNAKTEETGGEKKILKTYWEYFSTNKCFQNLRLANSEQMN